MTDLLTLDRIVPAMTHLARTEVRERSRGNMGEAARIHERLFDLSERAIEPNLALALTIRGIGRANALAIEIDADVVERAIRKPVVVQQRDTGRIFAQLD